MALLIPSSAPTLVIRRGAYEASGLTRAQIDERLGLAADEFRVAGSVIAIGPLPGEGSLADVIAELEQLGLVYYDDFFELSGNWPDWISLFVAGNEAAQS